jgi:gamma-glutamylputrescine oxidase
VVGTNGYTDRAMPYLHRRVVPVTAYVAATEPLPDGMGKAMIPRLRILSDTQRDLFWMRLSPDGKRLIFGARPRIFETDERTAAQDLPARCAASGPNCNRCASRIAGRASLA